MENKKNSLFFDLVLALFAFSLAFELLSPDKRLRQLAVVEGIVVVCVGDFRRKKGVVFFPFFLFLNINCNNNSGNETNLGQFLCETTSSLLLRCFHLLPFLFVYLLLTLLLVSLFV